MEKKYSPAKSNNHNHSKRPHLESYQKRLFHAPKSFAVYTNSVIPKQPLVTKFPL